MTERASYPLTKAERTRLVERAFVGLYKWYVDRSQTNRNWNPDRSFDWRAVRGDHSDDMLSIVEGFYAVEQYTPDYTSEVIRVIRKQEGRANFTLRWGAEEEKHAELWRNVLLFSRRRSPQWLDDYTANLRSTPWTLPWDQPIHMLLYTVLQERATELNYLNTALIAAGKHPKSPLKADEDDVLVQVARTIAIDEAAHYHFFLEGARLYLYYFPEETLEALCDVLRAFMMPASEIIPNYDAFIATLYEARVFGPTQYAREVARPALAQLGVTSVRRVEAGIKRWREVPDADGEMRDSATFDGLDYSVLEDALERLFQRIGTYERDTGLAEVSATIFARRPRAMVAAG